MKKHIVAFVLGAVLAIAPAAAANGFVAAPAVAPAIPSIESRAFAPAATPLVVAQVDTTATVTENTAPASPWYLSGSLWSALIAIVAGAIAIWQSKEKTKAEKINSTLVLGIEQVSQIPEVAAYEKKIKGSIQSTAERAGVQPALDKLVQLLTR